MTVVSCNTVESCRSVENSLNRADRKGALYSVASCHGAMSAEARTRSLDAFARGGRRDRILVYTDRAARGVDFGGHVVGHVVVGVAVLTMTTRRKRNLGAERGR